MDSDIRLLQVFRVVVDCGGLSASELELGIGRSTISKHISDLETRLGVKLCNRGRSGFTMTEEGERVLGAANNLFASIDTFQHQVVEIHQYLSGNLKLAFFDQTISNPASKLSAAIGKFDDVAPAVSLDISLEPPNVIEAGVIAGRYDIGIVPIHKTSSVLGFTELYSENMLLYCGRGHPLFESGDTADIEQKIRTSKYAGLSFNSPNMIVGQREKLTRSAEVQDEGALAMLILSGRYLGFLPDHMAKTFVDRGNMLAIGGRTFAYTSRHAAIIRRAPRPSRVLMEFLRCLASVHGVRVRNAT